ncbi:MAG: hypothetical protein QXT45_02255 [Candidatus Bilamarchaeaceae archaeon]
MGKLAVALRSSKLARPERKVEIVDLSRYGIDINRKIFARIKYADPVVFRAEQESLADEGFREEFARECVIALYDDLNEDKVVEDKPGALGALSIRLICPSLFGAEDFRSSNGAEQVFELDKDDLTELVKKMDGIIFASLYYEAISLASFVKEELEKEKNLSAATPSSPTPSTPQDSATGTA